MKKQPTQAVIQAATSALEGTNAVVQAVAPVAAPAPAAPRTIYEGQFAICIRGEAFAVILRCPTDPSLWGWRTCDKFSRVTKKGEEVYTSRSGHGLPSLNEAMTRALELAGKAGLTFTDADVTQGPVPPRPANPFLREPTPERLAARAMAEAVLARMGNGAQAPAAAAATKAKGKGGKLVPQAQPQMLRKK